MSSPERLKTGGIKEPPAHRGEEGVRKVTKTASEKNGGGLLTDDGATGTVAVGTMLTGYRQPVREEGKRTSQPTQEGMRRRSSKATMVASAGFIPRDSAT
jgi:hypothetical protein